MESSSPRSHSSELDAAALRAWPMPSSDGVALHARAGEVLAERFGVPGYLARELPTKIAALMESFARAQISA